MPPSFNAKVGNTTQIHTRKNPAIHVGDNHRWGDTGRFNQLLSVQPRILVGTQYRAPPIDFDRTPNSVTVLIDAENVGGCENSVRVNASRLGRLETGQNSFTVDRSILKAAGNQIVVSSDGCDMAGHDDFLLYSIAIRTK